MPKFPDPEWRAQIKKQAVELRKLMERHRKIIRESQLRIEKTNKLLKQAPEAIKP
jgi:hypothetical protein